MGAFIVFFGGPFNLLPFEIGELQCFYRLYIDLKPLLNRSGLKNKKLNNRYRYRSLIFIEYYRGWPKKSIKTNLKDNLLFKGLFFKMLIKNI